jgi:hypothetical protein
MSGMMNDTMHIFIFCLSGVRSHSIWPVKQFHIGFEQLTNVADSRRKNPLLVSGVVIGTFILAQRRAL